MDEQENINHLRGLGYWGPRIILALSAFLLTGAACLILFRIFFHKDLAVVGAATHVNILPIYKMEKKNTGNLKYFYEPPANEIASDSAIWLPYIATYHYNNDGLNNLDNYSVDKTEHTFRIVTLGDSFVYGMYVNTEDNFSEKLKHLLNSKITCPSIDTFEVINLGVPGYDIQYEVERFIKRGMKYNPDLLLWYMRDDDFFINNEKFNEKKKYYEEQLKSPKSVKLYTVDPLDKSPATSLAYEEFYKKYYAISSKTDRLAYIKPELQAYPLVRNTFSGPIVTFTFSETPNEYKNHIKELVQSAPNTYYFDNIPDVETFSPNDYHPTAAGHTKIAESLFQYLVKNQLKNCATVQKHANM